MSLGEGFGVGLRGVVGGGFPVGMREKGRGGRVGGGDRQRNRQVNAHANNFGKLPYIFSPNPTDVQNSLDRGQFRTDVVNELRGSGLPESGMVQTQPQP